MRNRSLWVMVLALLVLASSSVWAQGIPTGKLTGRVINEGAPLPGVLISATSPSLQGTRTTTSSANGDYIFPSLPPGDYTVTFELEGLETSTRTVTLATAQTANLDVAMNVAAISEEIVVTGQLETISQGSEAAVTFSKTLVDELPVGRTVDDIVALSPGVSATGPGKNAGTGQASIVISGAPSFENLFLINGVVVNENIRGQAFNLFIEDAIQETTTSSGSISAEYGRFTGGVVNVITKSGGNEFSGSLRSTLRNQDWTDTISDEARRKRAASTFVQAPPNDEIIPTYEATLGGPIWRDKVWFFFAGRTFDQEASAQTAAPTSIPYKQLTDEQRLEGKLTFSPTAKHTFIASYADIERSEGGNSFGTILDERSLVTRDLPQTLAAINYNGVLTENLYFTAQYNEREFSFVGSGAPTTDLIQGTLLIDRARGGARYWSPTFCGVCRDEERDNTNILGKVSYFLSTGSLGTHELVAGYDSFEDIRAADNHQSGSDYRILGTTSIIRGSNIFPVFNNDGTTTIQFNPIFEETRGTSFKTNSFFVNDAWRVNDRLSLNLGLRFDQNDGANAQGRKVAKDSNVSPRVAATWDASGDGSFIINGGYGKYVAAIANSVGDSTSSAGAPATFQWRYAGPAINLGNPANPADPAAALTTLFNWFNSVGGANNTSFLTGVAIPGGNVVIEDSLNSPNAEEFTIGFSKQFSGRGIVRVTAVHREFGDFYTTRGDLTTGTVTTPNGLVADRQVIENNDSAFEREYNGLQTQFQWRFGKKITAGGNWTVSKLEGNFDGETRNNGPVTGDLTYPEFKVASWNRPSGDLSADQRHKAALYGVYRFWDNTNNALSVSLFQSFQTGLPYGAVQNVLVRGGTGAAAFNFNPVTGYRQPPATVAYAFTAIDEFRTDDILRTDLSLNYTFRFRGAEIFISPEVTNVFNAQDLDTTDTRFVDLTVGTAATNGACRNSPTGRCLPFNPYTTTPVEGLHWQRGPNFGKAIGNLGYQTPRTFRVSVGVRF